MDKVKVLIDEETINKRLDEMARQIEKDYEGKEILMVCVLKGACFFAVNLAQRIKNNIYFEFIELSSYENSTKSSGAIILNKDIKTSIDSKDVIVVEDIIDTGRTLKYLIEHFKKRNPNSIKLCTLLDKPSRRTVDVKVDYLGFQIPDHFVVGCGLDYAQKYRNLPYIGCI